MKQIRTKTESDFVIRQLGLNRMLDGVFTKKDEGKVIEFLDNNVYPYYNMRDKSKAMGQFLYKLTAEEVISHVKDYDLFSVYESLADADSKYMLIQGEVQISSGWKVTASLSNIVGISNRVAMREPTWHLNYDLLWDREPKISGLKQIIDYIFEHELFDVIVEFTSYSIPVGINHEKLLIWELRNY